MHPPSPSPDPEITSAASLEDVLITGELARRSSRPRDHREENRALIKLTRSLANDPQTLLQELAETAVRLCEPATTAGISLLTHRQGRPVFHRPAAAGRLADQLTGVALGHDSPCGVVIDRNEAQLFRYPGRCYIELAPLDPPVVEVLLLPFRRHGRPIGTFWLISEDPATGFDDEDRRRLADLTALVEAGYRLQTAQADLGGMRRLQETSSRLVQEDDVQELYRELIDAAIDLTQADRGTIQLLDDETGELCLLEARDMPQHVWEGYARLSPEAQTSCAVALRRGERVIVDYVDDERVAGTEDARVHLEAGIRAAQSTPLVARSGRTLGMISTHWGEPHVPSEHQSALRHSRLRLAIQDSA